MHLGSKSKECLRSRIIIVAQAEGEGDKYAIWGILYFYSLGAYTNFLHEERKMHRLFSARRAYSTHFTRRVKKITFSDLYRNSYFRYKCDKNDFVTSVYFICVELIYVNVILGFKIIFERSTFSHA